MAADYRIFGAEMSPYSVKIRSYFRYKGIPHQWILRNAASQAEYEQYARMPIIPLVVTPQGVGIQDSTPIIDQIERLHPQPSIHPDDPVTGFISALIEEFGDEWGNKWMFHYRWARDVDQISSAGRIARMRNPRAGEQEHAAFASQVRARMVDRLWFVGSNAVTAPQIEAGFLDMLELLENHLAGRSYLFGARPAFGDFGLWGQFYELWTDPDRRRLDRGRRAACARLGAADAVAPGRGRVRGLDDAAADPDADPDQAGRAGSSCLGPRPTPKRLRKSRKSSLSRSATRSGSRSRRNITRDRWRRCAPDMRRSPTSPRSIRSCRPPVAWPDCMAEDPS